MGVEEQLTTRLTEAMRARNTRETDVLRMVKTMGTRDMAAPGFKGEADDAFWLAVIGRYTKQQKKALAEFEKLGDAAASQIEQANYEIDYLSPFLPELLAKAAVRELVKAAIEETGAAGPKMVGKIVGAVMKTHRDSVDPLMVKAIATEELG
ncbi:MAG: GatB/YqeY domain-containing protein [Deltaproteobacteria bacterium]|nr:GatB/YqeY domain-containing protein [Deltaproteobacteria bacterium]